jgi:hypothetical protein
MLISRCFKSLIFNTDMITNLQSYMYVLGVLMIRWVELLRAPLELNKIMYANTHCNHMVFVMLFLSYKWSFFMKYYNGMIIVPRIIDDRLDVWENK